MKGRWSPRRIYQLSEVIDQQGFEALKVGASVNLIESELGPPEHPPAKESRRSKIWTWTYGNLAIWVKDQKVTAFFIDFEGTSARIVDATAYDSWTLPDWEAFAAERGWSKWSISGVTNLHGQGFVVSLGPDGRLHVVTLGETTT